MSTIQHISETTVLNNGVQIPWLGLGTFKTDRNDAAQSVTYAVKAGYRLIDTASVYGNEAEVGAGIKECGIPRDQLFITTKVWNKDQGYESTLQAFEDSRRKLDLDVIDLYLIHWPVKGKYKETWKALTKLYKDGAVRAIGVSNFHIHHLKDLMEDSDIIPTVNQVEYHPLLNQSELRSFCEQNKIKLEAWSPLMQGNLDLPLLAELSSKYGKSPAQIILRWDLQNEVITIPKSIKEVRIIENASVFDFAISEEDMARLNSLNQNKRFGPDPENINF